jgi:hypothetical protein
MKGFDLGNGIVAFITHLESPMQGRPYKLHRLGPFVEKTMNGEVTELCVEVDEGRGHMVLYVVKQLTLIHKGDDFGPPITKAISSVCVESKIIAFAKQCELTRVDFNAKEWSW